MSAKFEHLKESMLLAGMFPENDLLPPFWRVIYYEAIRANHILFNPNDLANFINEPVRGYTPTIKDDGIIERIFVTLLKCSNITESQLHINQQPYGLRKQIFTMYLRYIDSLKANIKQSLN